MGQSFFQYRRGDRIARRQETVVHPPPLTPSGDDARVTKIRQMARDFWLAHPKDLHEVADANFLVGNQVEEAQPGRVGQGAKEQIEGERLLLSRHSLKVYMA